MMSLLALKQHHFACDSKREQHLFAWTLGNNTIAYRPVRHISFHSVRNSCESFENMKIIYPICLKTKESILHNIQIKVWKKNQIQPNQCFGPCSIAPTKQCTKRLHFHSQPENPSEEEIESDLIDVFIFRLSAKQATEP